MNSSPAGEQWDERASASAASLRHSDAVFESLFERCADAIWLYDPKTGSLVNCHQAAVELIGAPDKQQLLSTRPEDLSPPFQPDGSRSAGRTPEIIALVEQEKRYCFEWTIRRRDRRDVPTEVSVTAVRMGSRRIHVANPPDWPGHDGHCPAPFFRH